MNLKDLRSTAPAGHIVLDDVRGTLQRFIAFPSEHALDATALWAAHTHALDAFETTPRLALLSPEPGSGKTRVLEILELLCPRPVQTVNTTPAYLFRKVADAGGPPTILYDEIDTVFGPRAKNNEDIRGMLNAGYRRGATAGRCVTRGNVITTEEFPAFAAVALAGLHDLPDTIMTRCIVIRMKKRAPNEKVDPFRRRQHRADILRVQAQLADWMEAAREQYEGAWPELPDGITDRNADVWEPLIAVADAAGGAWPDRARVAAVALVAQSQEREPGLGIMLLGDLRQIFGTSDSLCTEDILEALRDLEESPWNDIRGGKGLDPRYLSKLLGSYGVTSKNIRSRKHGNKVLKGYDRGDLEDAWIRYLPAHSQEGSDETTIQPAPGNIADGQTPAVPPTLEGATSATSATANLRVIRATGQADGVTRPVAN